ncbi:hypothetical protein Avbf_10084 [Armadillidium vulgare]|nr:hypothetical protein Avbf_10084 [Armadillidium vulgare]
MNERNFSAFAFDKIPEYVSFHQFDEMTLKIKSLSQVATSSFLVRDISYLKIPVKQVLKLIQENHNKYFKLIFLEMNSLKKESEKSKMIREMEEKLISTAFYNYIGILRRGWGVMVPQNVSGSVDI